MTQVDHEDPRLTAVSLRRDLVATGWTDHMLVQAVRRGELARPRYGAYVDGRAWAALDAAGRHEVTARAVVAASRTGVVLSHATAATLHGSPDYGLDRTDVHVTRRDGRTGRAEAGVRQHRGRLLAGDETTVRATPTTSPTRTALELTTVLGVEPALVQVNDLLHRGLTTAEQLSARYENGMEHWPSSLRTDLVLRLADSRIESVAESRFVHLAWRQHLPAPQPQVEVADANGVVRARVDFAWPEHGVFLEVDGRVKYQKLLRPGQDVVDVVLREKKREELVCRLTGWRCLRVVWADLENPVRTARWIRSELERG